MLLKSKVSPIYHTLFPSELLSLEIPKQKYSDCSNCFHLSNKNNFRYHTKCCDYHPTLPNYMVGAILTNENPVLEVGRRRIQLKINARKGITPYGIIPPADYQNRFTIFRQKSKLQVITQQEVTALRCPFFQNGFCSIWQHRSEICSTFFCISSSGEIGNQFWQSFHTYLTTIEQKLWLYTMMQLGYPEKKLKKSRILTPLLKLENKEGSLNEVAYKVLWDEWEGKEEVFYIQCYKIVQKLNPKELQKILTPKIKILEEKIFQDAIALNSFIIPDYLKFFPQSNLIKEITKESFELTINTETFSFDSIQFKLIKLFNGSKSTYEILRKALYLRSDIQSLIQPFMQANLLKKI